MFEEMERDAAEYKVRRRLQAMSADELRAELRGLDQAIDGLKMQKGYVLRLLVELTPSYEDG